MSAGPFAGRACVRRALIGVAALGLAACAHNDRAVRAAHSADRARLYPYLVGIVVSDIERSASWYQGLGFQLTHRSDHPAEGVTIALLDHGAFRLELVEHTSPVLAQRSGTDLGFAKLTFHVADVRALAARLDGANFVVPVTENPQTGALSFIVRDPDGNWIGFEEFARAR